MPTGPLQIFRPGQGTVQQAITLALDAADLALRIAHKIITIEPAASVSALLQDVKDIAVVVDVLNDAASGKLDKVDWSPDWVIASKVIQHVYDDAKNYGLIWRVAGLPGSEKSREHSLHEVTAMKPRCVVSRMIETASIRIA